MKTPLIVAAIMLLVAVLPLPYTYYQILRVVITVIAVLAIIKEFKTGINPWIVAFGIIALIMNPLFPIHMDKSAWIPINIISAIVFGIKALKTKT